MPLAAAWALVAGALYATLNQFAVFPWATLLVDARDKLGHYTHAAFNGRVFLAAWGRHAAAAAAAALVLAGAWGWGREATAARGRARPLPDAWLAALALGLGIAGLGALGLGLVGLFSPGPVGAGLGAGVWLALRRHGTAFRFGLGWLRAEARDAVRVAPGAGVALGVMAFFTFWAALGPECGWDPAYYHLRLPKLYAMAHKIHFIPYIYPSHYPQAVEMLYGLGWLLAGEGAARLVNWSFWAACAAAVFRLAAPLGPRAAMRAAALAMTIPLAGTLADECYVDLGLSFFEVMSLAAALTGRPAEAGLLAGCAMGTKYTGIIAALALAVALLVRREGLRPVLVAARWSVLPVLPWLVRNGLFTGDPVAPFLYARLGTLAWAGGVSQLAQAEVIPKLLPRTWDARAHALLLGPREMLACGSFAVFSGWLLGMLPALGWRWAGRGPALRAWALTGTVAVLVLAPDGRYWQPFALPLAVLGAALWGSLEAGGADRRQAPAGRALGGLAGVALAFGPAYHAFDMHRLFTIYGVAAGLESPNDFDVRVFQPTPWYATTVAWCGHNVPRGERIAVVTDVQAYAFDRPAIHDCDAPGSKRWLPELARRNPDPAAWDRQFRQWRANTVYYIRGKAIAAARWGETWDERHAAAWARWWNARARLLLTRDQISIYALGPAVVRPSPRQDLPGPQEWLLVRFMQAAGPDERKAIWTRAVAAGLESAMLDGVLAEHMLADRRWADAAAAARRAIRIAPEVKAFHEALATAERERTKLVR